jgi:nitroreductase
MAICPTQSIQVPGLDYQREFISLPHRDTQAEESFYALIASRRAVRNFQDRPVPRELLEKIVQAVQFAPPSFPPIKTELAVVQDPALMRQALKHMVTMYDTLLKAMHHPIARLVVRRQAGAENFQTLARHVVPLMQSRLPELKSGAEDTITRGAPAMLLFHADRQAENYLADIYIAVAYAFLAAHACGLGATAIDLVAPVVERSPELRALFHIPPQHKVVAAVIVGFPQYRFQRGLRRELPGITWL